MKRATQRLRQLSRKPKQWQWVSAIALVLLFLIPWSIYKTKFLAGLWGLRNDEIAVITIEESDLEGNTPEKITVVAPNKSIWDGLELLGVPLVLAILGAWFQKTQQAQSERLSKEQREQDADETREEVLQLYFDRISALLIDKNLMAIAVKKVNKEYAVSDDQKELLEVSIDVIKARTLSILRRFDQDSERKSSVVRFLAEANVINRLRISLSNTNLCGASLNSVDLRGVNLQGVDLSVSNLNEANLSNAKLRSADLRLSNFFMTNLRGADLWNATLKGGFLFGADLSNATLLGADLSIADLREADLSNVILAEANLSEANLSKVKLNGSFLTNANLCGANLRGANLNDVLLYNANLQKANLRGANLQGADLREADLREADLREAVLSGINLRGAQLTATQLGLCISFSETEKVELKARGAIFDDNTPDVGDTPTPSSS